MTWDVPRWLHGVWRRTGRAVDGEPPEEVSDVVWAQVGAYFADVRVPTRGAGDSPMPLCHLDGPQAFSGTLSYVSGMATWLHDLDTKMPSSGSDDTAMLERRGSTLVEHGSGYLEYWRRAGRGRGVVLEQSHGSDPPAARIVVVGDLTVAVWSGRESGGATIRFEDGGWDVEAYLGTGEIPWKAVTEITVGRVPADWSRVA